METWILIGIIVWDGYKAGGVTTISQEFNSEQACIEVRDYLREQDRRNDSDIETIRCYKK